MNNLFKIVTSASKTPSPVADNKIVPLHEYEDSNHQILIEGLEIMMSIGLLPEEKQQKQRVLIDASLDIEPMEQYAEDIDNTVCYASVAQTIEAIAQEKHYDLVESLSTDITEQCLNKYNVQKMSVTVKKPDILKNADAVGFTMTRSKIR